jgi:hypoxanthine phosphoribosyltransferase
MKLSANPLITHAQIAARIETLAGEIERAYDDEELVVLCVLVGGLHFTSDLTRAMDRPTSLEFIRAKRYDGTSAEEDVKFLMHPAQDLEGKHVLVVEDILDTGITAKGILDYLRTMGPASLRCCTLLDKPSRREVDIEGDFVGFTIPDHFVVGYGLDVDERFRELSDIYILETSED